MKKEDRYEKIREILSRRIIETQEDLTEALRLEGIDVTQATVSRDIKELMLTKVPMGSGRYRYAAPPAQAPGHGFFQASRIARLFRDTVLSMDASENLIVVKTMPGAANAVASAIDYAKWPQVIGTIAGDDNILLVIKPKEAVPEVLSLLDAMMKEAEKR
ncbi:arginine repressor [uncultured Selenomonas sp.]|uniref:arginine repressor n=1 Tax=uncultured Selenomonas sp. TaxID=159275 RepID=UPI0025D3EE61|nr:arginine repressor [uncultured Selenomonas sp.]